MTIRRTETRLELKIGAPPARVWEILTTRFGDWWPESFNTTGPEGTMRLEAFAGGRMYEERADGAACLWATVCGIKPAAQLQVAGDLFPGWGGPARWLGTWNLSADGAGTVLRFEEVRIGATPDEVVQSLDQGWKYLLDCLRATVEGQPRPEWTG